VNMSSWLVVPGAAAGCYLAASSYLLRRPLHRTSPPATPCALVAHRGGAGEGYENTLAAFSRAVQAGAGMIELDVHLSRDGEVVVAHDGVLQRLTGQPLRIRDLAYSELPPLQPTISIDFCPGVEYSEAGAAEERRFVTLGTVLQQFPATQLNIDLKSGEQQLVEAVDSIIVQHQAETRCVWGNFSGRVTSECHAKNPQVGLLFSAPRVLLLYTLYYTGLLPFCPLRETHLELPMPSALLDPAYRTAAGNVGLARLPGWLLRLADWLLMAPLLFQHLAQRGVTTYLWVLNTEDQWQRAYSLGAQGVMTDYPSRLRQFLDKKQT